MSKRTHTHNADSAGEHVALYFAYGSNMHAKQMACRCPNAESLGAATLKGWAFNERTYADVEQRDGAEVEGVLWAVTARCIRALDGYEGYPSVYQRTSVLVDFNGERFASLCYYMTSATAQRRNGTRFTDEYASVCIEGALANGVELSDELVRHYLRLPHRARRRAAQERIEDEIDRALLRNAPSWRLYA
jgi:gamma-glutamylcyclotransferase (GGCT)/AIG2-like uncharacterized protein YtfP